MAIRNIVTIEDSILRKKSRPVVNFDKKLHRLLDDMKDTLEKAEGAGLAAVRVGILRRVVVIDIDDGKGYTELINPEIVSVSEEEREGEEGCLSLPGKWGMVKRPVSVTVRAQNRDGVWCLLKGEGLRARCMCHEIDHLDGHVYTDFVTRMLTEDDIQKLQEDRRKKISVTTD